MNKRMMNKVCAVGLMASCGWAYAEEGFAPTNRPEESIVVYTNEEVQELFAQLWQVEEAIAAAQARLDGLYRRYEAVEAAMAAVAAQRDLTDDPAEKDALTDEFNDLKAELDEIRIAIAAAEEELGYMQRVRQDLLDMIRRILSGMGGVN